MHIVITTKTTCALLLLLTSLRNLFVTFIKVKAIRTESKKMDNIYGMYLMKSLKEKPIANGKFGIEGK